jgi:hypothetical protein
MQMGRLLIRFAGIAIPLAFASTSVAQLNENCIVAVLNRTVQVNHDGSWVLPNIPAGFGLIRARATCVNNGATTFGQSDLFTIVANRMNAIPPIPLGPTSPIPTSIGIAASPGTDLTTAGATAQLKVQATYANNTTKDITAASTGTLYNVSNSAIATVATNGLVTAVSTGTVVIQAVNEGAQGLITIHVVLAGVSHGGIPDTWAIANGLDPNDPAMPSQDPDKDGLTNLQEFQAGTDPNKADTDGDGLTDGQEVLAYKTNPLVVSSDGTGIPDGIEVQTGTLGGTLSSKLAKSLQSLEVKPATFVLTVNSIEGQANQQLTVIGHLIDGTTTLDLTSTQTGTQYSSSDLTICNFGSPDGNVFAGASGTCTITVKNAGFTASATATVTGFTATPLGFASVPGYANGVAVNGNFAYVAAGGSGLQVVDVSNRNAPQVVASLALTGNSNGVRLLGNFAYVAGGSAGLQAVDISNPLAPVLRGSFGTGVNALNVAVSGTRAYVANTSNLFVVDVTNPAAMKQVSVLPLAGTIQGVAVDPVRKLAVVAAGTTGIYVVDVSNPAAPMTLGSVSTGNATQVAIQGNYAFVADYFNSTTSVDITTPSAPAVRSNITDPNLGGFLTDIVLSGKFALASDVKFFNGIPITDISVPTALQARAILKFTQRDDNGMGIAADGAYVYLATVHGSLTKFGTSEDSRLYIGQYLAIQDNKGIAPTVSISSPANGTTVIQGSTLPIAVNATDDVAVAAVNIAVNGQVVFTSTSQPYQFNYKVPTTGTSLTISATAVDYGGNIGTAQAITVNLVPDPGTTVAGSTVDASNNPIAGASVTCQGIATTSGTSGAFSISAVPTVQGDILCRATAVANGTPISGTSNAFAPVPGGTTNVGAIKLTPGATVLILADVDGPGPNALAAALTAANNTVTLRPAPEYTWDSTNPSIDQYNCIVHLNGATPYNSKPVQAQTALESFVQSGKGGYIGGQWDGYDRFFGYAGNMPDLILRSWDTADSGNCGLCTITYNLVPGQQNHPVLSGLPSSFTFFADGHDASDAIGYTSQPSIALMTVPNGGPAVLVRTFGSGRVVSFSVAPDYAGSQQSLQDPNIQKLFVNAVAWACQGR